MMIMPTTDGNMWPFGCCRDNTLRVASGRKCGKQQQGDVTLLPIINEQSARNYLRDALMKDKHISLYGKGPERLLGLLQDSLLEDSDLRLDRESSDESMKALLIHHLQMAVAMRNQEKSSTSSILNHANREVSATRGFTVGRFLLDPKTNIAVLNDLKDNAKRLAFEGDTEATREVGMALYYGAIASGLAYHCKLISSYSMDQIDTQLKKMQSKSWVIPELQQLFSKACNVCRNTDESKE